MKVIAEGVETEPQRAFLLAWAARSSRASCTRRRSTALSFESRAARARGAATAPSPAAWWTLTSAQPAMPDRVHAAAPPVAGGAMRR
jgi:hypothetical protein